MTTKPLWIATLLGACTANAASSETSARGHACLPDSVADLQPHDVLRIASDDGSVDLVVHAWTDREGALIDVHTLWQPSEYAVDPPAFRLGRAFAEVEPIGVDAWRLAIIHGASLHELRVAYIDDEEVVAFASVVTGDDEPTWCRLRSARFGATRIETRCEDASGSEVEGVVARAPD